MRQLLIKRFLATSAAATSKDILMRLRKSTGYTFQNCKKAVEKFGDDITSAEKWLHEEARKSGWAKMSTQRKAANGLIGVLINKNFGLMLELNCETDFVARNEKFRALTAQICSEISQNERKGESGAIGGINKWEVNVEKAQQIKSVVQSDCEKINDLIAFNVGQLGERIILKRAVCLMAAPKSSLVGYVHPKASLFNGVLLGQFGTIVCLEQDDSLKQLATDEDNLNVDAIGSMICQHIVGMNPVIIGSPLEKKEAINLSENDAVEQVELRSALPKVDASDDEEGNESIATTTLSADKELLKQDFLLNPDIKIAEFLKDNHVKIVDFIRYECGELSSDSSS